MAIVIISWKHPTEARTAKDLYNHQGRNNRQLFLKKCLVYRSKRQRKFCKNYIAMFSISIMKCFYKELDELLRGGTVKFTYFELDKLPI